MFVIVFKLNYCRFMFFFWQVFKLGLAKSIHHARVLIKQKHIRVRKQVRKNNQKYMLHLEKNPVCIPKNAYLAC